MKARGLMLAFSITEQIYSSALANFAEVAIAAPL
jgi:hypothetical protein